MIAVAQDRCWGELCRVVRTGEPNFERLYDRTDFASMAEHPEQARNFDVAMPGFGVRAMKAVLDAFDLSGVATLADVGGGLGTGLAVILDSNPTMRGLLFDMPKVVERARQRIEASGLADRCSIEGEDFFEKAPGGADAYLLGQILHDWDET